MRGYTAPLTPEGRSSIVPPPPWHFSGEMLWISYRADPDACRALLPAGLTLADREANAAIVFCEWQWCGDDEAELHDPERGQFREALITLDCEYAGRPVARVPYAWVDSVVPLVRGLLQGLPKLPGAVHLTRAYEVGRASSRKAPGGRFNATLTAQGRRLLTGAVEISGRAAAPPALATQPFVHTRHLPGWGALPEQNDLVRSKVSGVEFGAVWHGRAKLDVADVEGLEVAALAPLDVLDGYVFAYAETLEPGGPA
ncbi:acetoacetate decarboxylase family protein [Plantactinospora sp. WMMC1484]|uniref:acetoacetate decarboxylase family protein n=1 Tax=Plantactinospora sp. WMMC1484 TaxID=3404122 RepID=UPI003BF50C7C